MNEVDWAEMLAVLGGEVREAVMRSRAEGLVMNDVVGHEGGDTIFAIDRQVEPIIERAVERWPGACKPLVLIAEGMGDDGVKRWGSGAPKFKLIIDPIDGTRGLMYDKRSAWFIAAVCPGSATSVADAIASVIVELPASKAGYVDSFRAAGARLTAVRDAVAGSAKPQALSCRTSGAATLLNGFGQVSNFFPNTKVIAAELMQRIADATIDNHTSGATVFDDQYISTAGQFVELMTGHDRFCCDLRPLFYRALGLPPGLECHPYDVAGMLCAKNAGVILTDGLGNELRPPLDVFTGVHWCGYANEQLRAAIEPVIVDFFREKGVTTP